MPAAAVNDVDYPVQTFRAERRTCIYTMIRVSVRVLIHREATRDPIGQWIGRVSFTMQ
jgi:hypothetical protein